MNTCKNCRFWYHGECTRVSWNFTRKPEEVPPGEFQVNVSVYDDSDICVELRTGPDFGCVKFEERK